MSLMTLIGDSAGYELRYKVKFVHETSWSPMLTLLQIWDHDYCWLCNKAVIQALEGFYTA